jgi:quercetin dioxygenase-like cupin family protein
LKPPCLHAGVTLNAGTVAEVKRHRALIPLSHDHHDALVAARRLERAADSPDPVAGALAFLAFFDSATVPHFREEEELLFPCVAEFEGAREMVVAALLEHQRLHARAAQLKRLVGAGTVDLALMRDLAALLESHVRLEERQLFPLIESLLADEALADLAFTDRRAETSRSKANRILWATESEDLNATLLSWAAGEGPPAHINGERDVLIVVLEGSLIVSMDEEERTLNGGDATIIAKGQRRKITAADDGAQYLSVHRRRPPLQINRLRSAEPHGDD